MFSDNEGPKICFKNVTKQIKQVTEEIQTDDIELELDDQETQTNIVIDNSTQTNFKDVVGESEELDKINFDSSKLQKIDTFITSKVGLILEALENANDEILYFFDNEGDQEEYESELISRINTIDNTFERNSKVSDSCWNNRGNILGISYYVDNHEGPCSHTSIINILKFENIRNSKNYKEKISCVKCLEFHPRNPNILVAGTFLGEIIYIDLLQEKEQILYTSKVETYFHKECIISLKWVNCDNNHLILSISEEGKLLLWNPDNKLLFPTSGYLLKYKSKDTAIKTPLMINPINICENPNENLNFLIGTLDGTIYKCVLNKPGDSKFDHIFNKTSGMVWRKSVRQLMDNMLEKDLVEMKANMERFFKDKQVIDINTEEFFSLKPDINKIYKNALKSNFEKHISLVNSISYNSFIKNLFFSCSYDGSLRLYHQLNNKFILSEYLNGDSFTNATWSSFKPSLVVAGTMTGRTLFYKIDGKRLKLIHQLERKIENSSLTYPIAKIKYNSYLNNILSIIYEDGMVDLIDLTPSFYSYNYDEISKLNKLISNFII